MSEFADSYLISPKVTSLRWARVASPGLDSGFPAVQWLGGEERTQICDDAAQFRVGAAVAIQVGHGSACSWLVQSSSSLLVRRRNGQGRLQCGTPWPGALGQGAAKSCLARHVETGFTDNCAGAEGPRYSYSADGALQQFSSSAAPSGPRWACGNESGLALYASAAVPVCALAHTGASPPRSLSRPPNLPHARSRHRRRLPTRKDNHWSMNNFSAKVSFINKIFQDEALGAFFRDWMLEQVYGRLRGGSDSAARG